MASTVGQYFTFEWTRGASSFLAVLGILVGVFKYATGQPARISRSQYSFHKLWSLVRGTRKETGLPEMPSLSTILKLGEFGVVTSSMFDWMRASSGSDAVSWAPLYEAYFMELAWDSVAEKDGCSITFCRALQAARERVQASLEHVPDSEKTSPESWDRHILHSEEVLPGMTQADGFSRRAHEYERRRSSVKHKLERCIVSRGRRYGSFGDELKEALQERDSGMGTDFQEICIQNGRPCIRVSPNELAALALALGILLRFKYSTDDVLEGEGSFGLMLSARPMKHSEQWWLSVTQLERGPEKKPTKGSGYLLSSAIRMACKCLPFAQHGRYTHVVRVTPNLCNQLKNGNSIKDEGYPRHERSSEYLRKLPAATRSYFYSGCSESRCGDICSKDEEVVGHWYEAVARIAFGGLIPLAAVDLVDVVRFTAAGGTQFVAQECSNFLACLEELIWEVQSREKEYDLFGLSTKESMDERVNCLKHGIHHQPCAEDITWSSAFLGRLGTLFEYLTATTMDNKGQPLQEVFDATCAQLKLSYAAALQKQQGSEVEFCNEALSLIEDLDDLIVKFKVVGSLSVNDCGRIARYIVLAWTYCVGLVVWDEPGTKEDHEKARDVMSCPGTGTHHHHARQKIYSPIPLAEFPQFLMFV